jgi:SnoaL-like domain
VLNPIVDVDSDATAATRSTFCVVQDTETVPIQPIVVGRYYDRFGHDDGGWYFTERKVEIQMIGDVSAHLMVNPAAFEK